MINIEVGHRHHITAHDTIQPAQVQYFGIECAYTEFLMYTMTDARLGIKLYALVKQGRYDDSFYY